MSNKKKIDKVGKCPAAYVIPGLPRGIYMGWQDFVKKVCKQNGVTIEQVKGKSRKREIVDARFIIAYFLVKYYGMTQEATAKKVKVKNHSSIFNAIKQVENLIITDQNFKRKYEKAESLLI